MQKSESLQGLVCMIQCFCASIFAQFLKLLRYHCTIHLRQSSIVFPEKEIYTIIPAPASTSANSAPSARNRSSRSLPDQTCETGASFHSFPDRLSSIRCTRHVCRHFLKIPVHPQAGSLKTVPSHAEIPLPLPISQITPSQSAKQYLKRKIPVSMLPENPFRFWLCQRTP